MPVSITARGGPNRIENVTRLTQAQARDALRNIQVHLGQGRASGVLTLFNRTKDGTEMTLERKNRFQLMFGYGERLEDTKNAMLAMLQSANLPGAEEALEQYLAAKPKGEGNRISARQMLTILNDHLGNADEPPRAAGLREDDSDHRLDADEAYELMAGGGARPERQPSTQLAGSSPSEDPLDAFLDQAKVTVSKQVLGKGGLGEVNLVQMPGLDEPLVLKRFFARGGERVETPLTAQRGECGNEAMAAYLSSSKDPHYEHQVNVVQPRFFIVNVGKDDADDYRMVTPRDLRTLLKTEPDARCAGLLMPKAAGSEGWQLLDKTLEADHHEEGKLRPEDKAQMIKGTLQSLRKLSERGFVHHDLKLSNIFFDPNTGKTTLIDTGMMHKASKNKPATNLVNWETGTPHHMHPRVLWGAEHGSDADLYATAVMALMLEHGEDGMKIAERMEKKASSPRYGLLGVVPAPQDVLQQAIYKQPRNEGRERSPEWVVRPGLEKVHASLEDPNSLTHLAMECMRLASEPAADWADRNKAQAFYAQLLEHPSLK